MKSRIKNTLYVSDLDGTLLAPDGRLSSATVTLMNHAVSEGALFSVATARTPATVSTLLREVNVNIPLVVMTGAALWDKATGEYSEVQFFRPSQVREIIGVYESVSEGGCFLYTLARGKGPGSPVNDIMEIYHVGTLNAVEREFMEERIGNPYKRFFVDAEGHSDIPAVVDDAVLFFGMRPERAAQEIRARLHKIAGINPMFYYDWHAADHVASVEAFPAGATKAQAILRLKRLVGADRVVVFGDNMNDLSMMAAADWSVAVGNALPEVKRAAEEVIGTNASDSVARFILEDMRK